MAIVALKRSRLVWRGVISCVCIECLAAVKTANISNLRKKLDPDHRGIIETVRGAGYIFSDV